MGRVLRFSKNNITFIKWPLAPFNQIDDPHMKTLILRIFFLFCWLPVIGQEIHDEAQARGNIDRFSRLVKFVYTPPKGYNQIYMDENARVGKLIFSGSDHRLESLSDSLVVYFILNYVDTTLAVKKATKLLGIDIDPNRFYLKTSSDTLQNPINHYSQKKALKIFNADAAGTYDIPLTGAYRGKYGKCKVLFVHKENRADVYLHFFYNPSVSDKKLTRHINTLSKHIKFLD